MDAEVLASVTQFGVAGLIGWMWITERRAAAAREKQVDEVHDRLMRERRELELMMEVVRENTRALSAVEAGQRAVADAVERLGARLARCTGCGASPETDGRAA